MIPGDSIKSRYIQRVSRLRLLFPDVPDFVFEELLSFETSAAFRLRVQVHTGPSQHLEAFIVHHCNPFYTGEQPYKGGLQKGHDVTQEKIEGKAMNMTEKVGVFNLKLGGGKAGITLQKDFPYTSRDHAEINRVFVEEADKRGLIGPRKYSTATDEGTTEADCDSIALEFITRHENEPGAKGGVATGKSTDNGGHPARKNATGRGGLIVLRQFFDLNPCRGQSMVIEGFGNVGRPTFMLAQEYGFVPVAVGDINGGIYNPRGLNIKDVSAYHERHKTFAGYTEADAVTNDELLELPCDVLVPAAKENRLTKENAGKVRARHILELANGPTTTEGEHILTEKGIIVIPDILANAGGVIASWIELNMNKERDLHPVEFVREEQHANEILREIMEESMKRALIIQKEKTLSLRDAAAFLSLSHTLPRLAKKHARYL